MIISHQFTTTSILHHHLYLNWNIIPQLINNLNFYQQESGLLFSVPEGDDPIDAIHHIDVVFDAVITSCYPTTNNQLTNSSNPRQQATINNRRVTLKPIQGRQTSVVAGTLRTYTLRASGNNSGKQRTVICYNYKGEGHMSKQCTKPKNQELPEGQAHIDCQNSQCCLSAADLVMNDESVCDELNMPKLLSCRFIHYGYAVAVQNSNSSAQQDDLILSVIEQLKTQEQVKVLKEGQNVDLKSQDNVSDSCAQSVEIDHLKRTLSEHLKEKESLLQTVTLLKNDFKKEESRNLDSRKALGKIRSNT
ncbi:hypothetical protein Tco_1146018 [Tanacetum coccineum]